MGKSLLSNANSHKPGGGEIGSGKNEGGMRNSVGAKIFFCENPKHVPSGPGNKEGHKGTFWSPPSPCLRKNANHGYKCSPHAGLF